MPQNLNALIRYKTIDRCLRNRFKPCTIEVLIETCSEALGEARGVYRKVSERTIRDDLRVMRSDSLGFEAPINVKDGVYFYDDPEYSIFNVPIREKAVLEKVLKVLIDNRKQIGYDVAIDAIMEISRLRQVEVPKEIMEEIKEYLAKKAEHVSTDRVMMSISKELSEKMRRRDEIRKSVLDNEADIDQDILLNREAVSRYSSEAGIGANWLYHWLLLEEVIPDNVSG